MMLTCHCSIQKNKKNRIPIVVLTFFSLIMASSSPGEKKNTRAIPIKPSPCFNVPVQQTLTKTIKVPGDTCILDSVYTDQFNKKWYLLQSESDFSLPFWSPAQTWVTLTVEDTLAYDLSSLNRLDPAKKERLKVILKHPEWSRKIKRTVREGKICLEMNSKQLETSWGEPFKILAAFLIGTGEFDLWLYKTSQDSMVTVSLKDNKIIGWSR